MRPVNLIPVEERRDGAARLRGGPLAYFVIGGLIAVLAGVTILVSTSNDISTKKAEVTRLGAEAHRSEAKASRLASYVEFQAVHDQRVATITSLANSRFDWERVVRELSLVLPSDVWLTNLTGTASPSVSVSGSASIALRDSVPGPALEILGCASSQDAVAGFISELKQIDGVTRVAVESTVLGDAEEAGGGATAEGGVSTQCQTRKFIAQFSIVAAFDNAPVGEAGVEEG
jgi:Tfp pilus assembly protein PilN